MPRPIRVLIPDSIHIKPKNFPSLFKAFEREKADITVVKERDHLIANYGKYSPTKMLTSKINILRNMSSSELFKFRVLGVNLFSISQLEIMSLAVANDHWHEGNYPETPDELFSKLYKLHREVLLHNLSMAWDWVEYWSTKTESLPIMDICCVFSGSLIYQKALIEILKVSQTKVFILESTFTGNDYYFEEKYDAIPNNADIKFSNIYRSIEVPEEEAEFEKERNKAYNKILLAKNKNVKQPDDKVDIQFPNSNPTVLVVGQVVNDFSLLNTGLAGLSSINFYRELIGSLLRANYNVIFKGHPWELQKSNLKTNYTTEKIEDYIATLPKKLQNNIIVCSDVNLYELFKLSSYIVGLNSQALIEAAFYGYKPIQFGDAFFGNRGFTHDYAYDNIPELIRDISTSNNFYGNLTLSEFNDFEIFCVKFFQNYTIASGPSGTSRILSILGKQKEVSIVSKGASPAVKGKAEPARVERSNTSKKYQKLVKDPYAFFRDSKYWPLSKFSLFFTGK